MLKLASRVSKRLASGYISSDSEAAREPHLRGVVVRHLPLVPPSTLLPQLQSYLSCSNIDLKLDAFGNPGYAIARFNDEMFIKSSKKLNKQPFLGRKLYICSINEFMTMSPALGSGHDARRVVVFKIPREWNAEKIYEIFSSVGNVMELDMPIDYETGASLVDGEAVYREVMGVEPIDLASVKMTGFQSLNVFVDFRAFVMDEIKFVEQMLSFKGNNTKAVFDAIYALWGKVRKFKDLMGQKPTVVEAQVESGINGIIGKSSNKDLKENLRNVVELLLSDFKATMNPYFGHKGYAKITYATRTQAERAVALSAFLSTDLGRIRVLFNRDIPDYFYDTKLVGEAEMREMFKIKHKVESESEFNIKINHHLDKFKTKVETYMRLKDEHLGPEENGDPLINQKARSEEEAKDAVVSIEAIDDFGGQRRERYFNNDLSVTPTGLLSSSDDILEEDRGEHPLPASGRLYDKRNDLTQKLMKDFILAPNEIPTHADDIDDFKIIPDMEFPREYPPTKHWSSHKDRVKARQKLMTYEAFFHEKLPEDLKTDPSTLQKLKFGDFPNFRYAYEPEFDYLLTPDDLHAKDKRKVLIRKIREKIRNINAETPENKANEEMIEIGEEEIKVLNNPGELTANSDSDVDRSLREECEDMDLSEFEQKDPNEEYKKLIKDLGPDLIGKHCMSFTRSFKYEGNDIDEYIKSINSIEGFDAKYAINVAGETIVHVVCKTKYRVDLAEVEYLYKKYGEQILSAKDDEIEIDEEDQEKMQRLVDLDIEPNELISELVLQGGAEGFQEAFERYTSVEPIKKWGHFTPMVQEVEEVEQGLNTIFDLHDETIED